MKLTERLLRDAARELEDTGFGACVEDAAGIIDGLAEILDIASSYCPPRIQDQIRILLNELEDENG